MEKRKKVIVPLENGVQKVVYLSHDNQIGDSYWVKIEQDQETYFCLIEQDGIPITPLLKQRLISSFSSKDNQNICIEIQDEGDSISYFYHYQKKCGRYRCVFSTNDLNKSQFVIEKTCYDNYWLIISPDKKSALYSPEQIKQLTPFFDELELIEMDSPHLAFFSKNIWIQDCESENIIATSIVGYIGYDGEFSSRIYDTEDSIYQREEDRYYIILKRGLDGIKGFTHLCKNLSIAYQNMYDLNQIHLEEVIDNLFLEKVTCNDASYYKIPTKIIEFPKR